MRKRKSALFPLCVMVVLALIGATIAGCGGSNDDSGDSGGSDVAVGDAPAGAESVSESVDVGPKTIAYIDLVGQASGAQKIRAAAEEEADDLGWTLEKSDAGGDIQQVANLIDSAITKKVDGIVGVAVPVEAVGAGISKAKSAGIPYVAVNSGFSPDATFSQLTQEWAGASTEALYVANRLGGKGKIAIISSKTLSTVTQREAGFMSVLKSYPEIEVVSRHEIDLTDLVGDAQSATSDVLQGNSDLDAVWAAFEDPGIGAMNAIQQSGSDAFVVTYAEGGPLLQAQRDGKVAAVLAFPLVSHGRYPLAELSQYLDDPSKPTGLAFYNDLTFLADRDQTPDSEVLNTPSYLLYEPSEGN